MPVFVLSTPEAYLGLRQPRGRPPDAQIWRAADKIVYSSTLEAPASERTRIERDFDPDAVGRLKTSADRDISIGGPHLAAAAIGAGLVDEYHLFLVPVMVGAGNRALADGIRADLELVDDHRFASGFVHLHYRAAATYAG